MLSPGTYHRAVPKDLAGNYRFRKALLGACRKSAGMRRAVLEACGRDLLFWVNAFVWQYNPRKKDEGERAPFVTWDFQDAAMTYGGNAPRTGAHTPGMLECIEDD